MNTAELKPIDARTMKPGDPVVRIDRTRKEGTLGRFIGYVPEADEDYRCILFFEGDGIPTVLTIDGRPHGVGTTLAFYPPDPDPIDPSPGNVNKLRKSQIPKGHRIPAHDEKPDRRARRWVMGPAEWQQRGVMAGETYNPSYTYLVPIAPIHMVPLSMEDFVGEPWPLVKYGVNDCVWMIASIHANGVAVGSTSTLILWANLREHYPISWDHGVTWVRAEKEEQA